MSASPTIAIDFAARPRLVVGAGVLACIGDLVVELGGTRVLLVTDPGIVAAGHAERACGFLRNAGLVVTVHDQVRANPGTVDVDACLAVARTFKPDIIVGLGGGSAMDTAKGCNLLLTNGGKMVDYWHTGAAKKPLLPFIAVPTTAGTGSECQSFALIVDEGTHRKMACGDAKALARVALLDPELTASLPRTVAALTGLDALVHAVETLVTTRRTPVSHLFAREAFVLIHEHLPRVLSGAPDLAVRQAMLLGAAYAGLAIENSMLGAAHACANPLTAHHGIVHGQAVAMMLPAVMRWNAQDPATAKLYAELATHAGLTLSSADQSVAVAALQRRVAELIRLAGLPVGLAACGVSAADLPKLASDAATQWTGRYNPRPLHGDDILNLYRAALVAEEARHDH
ncbi:MAG: iron-containing alcohol dehydrogenase [Planctomycetota bacterium]